MNAAKDVAEGPNPCAGAGWALNAALYDEYGSPKYLDDKLPVQFDEFFGIDTHFLYTPHDRDLEVLLLLLFHEAFGLLGEI